MNHCDKYMGNCFVEFVGTFLHLLFEALLMLICFTVCRSGRQYQFVFIA